MKVDGSPTKEQLPVDINECVVALEKLLYSGTRWNQVWRSGRHGWIGGRCLCLLTHGLHCSFHCSYSNINLTNNQHVKQTSRSADRQMRAPSPRRTTVTLILMFSVDNMLRFGRKAARYVSFIFVRLCRDLHPIS